MANLISTRINSPKVLIWGLKSVRHSHRYIHAGFFLNFQQMGYETQWVDDELKSQELLKPGTIVISVNVASRFLVKKPNVHYVLHNINPSDLDLDSNFINLQVHTSATRGVSIGSEVLKWDYSSRTLFQPWGIPIDESDWLEPSSSKGNREYWVGAIWQNSLSQGNREVIDEYRNALRAQKISFRRVGGVRWLTKNGVSEKLNLELVNRSPLGASIVGEWQREKKYVPCRFFKNIAAGAIPISNSNFDSILGVGGIYSQNFEELTDLALACSAKKGMELNLEAKNVIKLYSYRQAINRILNCLEYSN
jgi:hypothetical protein